MMTFKTISIVALHIIFSLDILPLLVVDVQTVLTVNIDTGQVEQAVEAGNLKLSVDNIVSFPGVSHREFRQIKLSPSTSNIVHC